MANKIVLDLHKKYAGKDQLLDDVASIRAEVRRTGKTELETGTTGKEIPFREYGNRQRYDETAYLLGHPANRARLLEAVENVANKRNLVAMDLNDVVDEDRL